MQAASEASPEKDDPSQSPSDGDASVRTTEPAPSAESADPAGNPEAKSALNATALAALNRKTTADLQLDGEDETDKKDEAELPELSEHVKKLRHNHLNQFQRSLKSLILSH